MRSLASRSVATLSTIRLSAPRASMRDALLWLARRRAAWAAAACSLACWADVRLAATAGAALRNGGSNAAVALSGERADAGWTSASAARSAAKVALASATAGGGACDSASAGLGVSASSSCSKAPSLLIGAGASANAGKPGALAGAGAPVPGAFDSFANSTDGSAPASAATPLNAPKAAAVRASSAAVPCGSAAKAACSTVLSTSSTSSPPRPGVKVRPIAARLSLSPSSTLSVCAANCWLNSVASDWSSDVPLIRLVCKALAPSDRATTELATAAKASSESACAATAAGLACSSTRRFWNSVTADRKRPSGDRSTVVCASTAAAAWACAVADSCVARTGAMAAGARAGAVPTSGMSIMNLPKRSN